MYDVITFESSMDSFQNFSFGLARYPNRNYNIGAASRCFIVWFDIINLLKTQASVV